MIRTLTQAARRLDQWLQQKIGRPYNALLGVGLTIEIVRRVMEAPKKASEAHGLIALVLMLALDIALLIHQVGEFSRDEAAAEPEAIPSE